MLLVLCVFLALGSWQVKRLFWKLDLIARVDQRVHADPTLAPGPTQWSEVQAGSHEYLHVRLSGTYLYDKTARVQAASIFGSGYWIITPLRSADGSITFINRGFVTGSAPASETAVDASAIVDVRGLLRMSEPGGGFLRHNTPGEDRWFSRDVAALAASRQLSNVAPYFIDADADITATSNAMLSESQKLSAGVPIGGLTVVSFPNNHLVYALTWYALALMMAGACFWIVRDEKRQRQQQTDRPHQESNNGKQA